MPCEASNPGKEIVILLIDLALHERIGFGTIINKSFDEFERRLADNIVSARVGGKLVKKDIFRLYTIRLWI